MLAVGGRQAPAALHSQLQAATAQQQVQSAERLYQLHHQAHSNLPLDVHPDYMSVLTACAALLWVKPALLHTHVCQLEQQMVKAEASLSRQSPCTN